MARPKNVFPTYKKHPRDNTARCWVDGRWVSLGVYDSPESKAEYQRICNEIRAGGTAIPSPVPTPVRSLNEILLAFWRHAEQHYRRADGSTTKELKEYQSALRPVRALYGHAPAAEFGPVALQAVRRRMVELGWCRTRVNKQVGRVRRAFKWAASQELVPVAAFQALTTVGGLQRGRTDARETGPVGPVDPGHLLATLPRLVPTVRAMVELQRYSGMRPGEARLLQPSDLDTSGSLWVYRPGAHKMAHLGRTRTVPLGPKARGVIVQFLTGENPPPEGWTAAHLESRTGRLVMADAYEESGRAADAALLRDTARPVVLLAGCVVDPDAYLFTPANAREERFRIRRAARKSKVPPSQMNRRKPAASLARKFRAVFSDDKYAAAVRRACVKVGVPPWHPNQLRHLFATEVRALYGLEAAQGAARPRPGGRDAGVRRAGQPASRTGGGGNRLTRWPTSTDGHQVALIPLPGHLILVSPRAGGLIIRRERRGRPAGPHSPAPAGPGRPAPGMHPCPPT